ncbi:MAG: hypothetical protein LQ342_008078 [Letrouitia transgressa]|nr:MAG: hypothetical protein LQ342_008078 [Letrouitia transgressa]
MSPQAISETRLLETKGKMGQPSLDNIDDYLERLKKETQIDGSLNDYLDWVQSSDTEDSLYQLSENWLQQLSTVQFSDALAATNLRNAFVLQRDRLPVTCRR